METIDPDELIATIKLSSEEEMQIVKMEMRQKWKEF